MKPASAAGTEEISAGNGRAWAELGQSASETLGHEWGFGKRWQVPTGLEFRRDVTSKKLS